MQALKLANVTYLIDQAPQFNKALDQAHALLQHWRVGRRDGGMYPLENTF